MKLRNIFLGSTLIVVTGLAFYASFAQTTSKPTTGAAKQSTKSIKSKGSHYVPLKKSTPTFNRDIAPIMFDNCAPCHRPGEVAPFALQNYKDAKKRARQIALVTESRYMPPWKADPHYGDLTDARRLSDEQIQTIKQWAEAGAPEGNPADLPKLPKFTNGWQLGAPDVVLEPSESYSLAADGPDVYRCFVIPTDYAEDRYISAMEVRPGNRAVVHHVIAFLDTKGRAHELDAADPGPGYTSFGGVGFLPSGTLGGWAPGNTPRHTPPGVGLLLPKGASVVVQVHYHPSGKPETDRTKIGLHFCKAPVDKRLRVMLVINPFLRIPPGDANYVVKASQTLPIDVTALAVMPHMHLLGKEMTVTATLPDGAEKRLVKVTDWDFNWQTTYGFKQPVKLPKGTRVNLIARYDNSESNPRNPSHPPRQVTWGEQTTDEMCIAFIPYVVDEEHLTQGIVVDSLPFDFGRR